MRIKVSLFDSLKEAQFYALGVVDEKAGQARARYLSSGYGQEMEYQEAYRQAVEFQNNPTKTYLMLEADVDAGIVSTVADAANLVLQRRQEWERVGKLIRSIRLKAKREIREATTQRRVAEIREVAVQDLAAL